MFENEDAIRHIFRIAEQDIRGVVCSERNAQALAGERHRGRIVELEREIAEARTILGCEPDCTLADRARAAVVEIERLKQEKERLLFQISTQREEIIILNGECDKAQALARQLDGECNRLRKALVILRGLVDAVAGEQEDPEELARALGKDAPHWIARARELFG